jgi:hypothetical protein
LVETPIIKNQLGDSAGVFGASLLWVNIKLVNLLQLY